MILLEITALTNVEIQHKIEREKSICYFEFSILVFLEFKIISVVFLYPIFTHTLIGV